MNLEHDLYPIISNKIIRQKDWKSIKEHKPGFWSRKDIEGIVLFAHKEVIPSIIKTFQ